VGLCEYTSNGWRVYNPQPMIAVIRVKALNGVPYRRRSVYVKNDQERQS